MPDNEPLPLTGRTNRSFSEMNTFANWCELQHFYRYYLQLASTRYEDLRHFIPGRLVHDTIESAYNGEDPQTALRRHRQQELQRLRKAGVDVPQMRWTAHVAMARNLVDVFADLRRREPYTALDTEVGFETRISEVPLRGKADQLYRRPVTGDEELPGWLADRLGREDRSFVRLIGEVKVRSSGTFPSSDNYEGQVRDDLQTHLYLTALERELQTSIDGIVHTSYRKAPPKYRSPEQNDSPAAIRDAIDAYYGRARTPVRRAEVLLRPPGEELAGFVEQTDRRLREFYDTPYSSALSVQKPPENQFPCVVCEFRRICQGDDPIDDSYRHRGR